MLGLLTAARAARIKPALPTFAVRATVARRRRRAVEREFRRMVANGELPREFGTPSYEDRPRRRW
jgi:hypothetical protein